MIFLEINSNISWIDVSIIVFVIRNDVTSGFFSNIDTFVDSFTGTGFEWEWTIDITVIRAVFCSGVVFDLDETIEDFTFGDR
jgi:hypothetical protein